MSEFNLEAYLEDVRKSPDIDNCPKVPVPKIEKDQNYIFVSYSHKDYKEVYYDLAHLYCHGVRFWYDRGLQAGEDWENEVKEHIQSPCCCGVIFYLSTNMFLSESIFKEIEFTNAKKKPNIILQKNYFCVNLKNSNISDMLFEVQGIQRNTGMAPLDTKKLNTLTATFSDDDTYIKYNSSYHIDELIEQIQNKFDVTNRGNGEPDSVLALDNIKEPRLAWLVINTKEMDLVPLFQYLWADFKRTKRSRPWILFALGVVISILGILAALYLLGKIPNVPLLSAMDAEGYKIAVIVVCCVLTPWEAAQAFWLFYISPVARNRDKGILAKMIHCLVYFLMVLALSAVALLAGVISSYLAFLLVRYLSNFLK